MTHPRVQHAAATIVALLAIGWLATAAPATAAGGAPRLGLTPVDHEGAYFQLTLDPGEQRSLRVEAANFGDSDVDARTYVADAYSIVNGGFGADLFGSPPSGTSLWVQYPAQEAKLGPQDAIVLDFDVTVPVGTPPGEYVTSLVIENVDPHRGTGSVAIDQVNRNAIAVAIDVPGAERAELEIGAVDHQVTGGFSVVTFEIDNPGNRHLRPAGEFRLFDAAGRELAASPRTMDSVYAGTSTLLEAPMAELLPAGEYCAELRLTDAETGATDATECLAFRVGTTPGPDGDAAARPTGSIPLSLPSTDLLFGATPWIAIALVTLLLGGLAFLLHIRRRRRRRRAQA